MMEMADYWILEKDLVPKLFQVIVPRYENKLGPYTQVYKLPNEYPGKVAKKICMELKDNALPPIQAALQNTNQDNSLTNILIGAYKKDYKFRSELKKFN